jgi:hypothetical protein
MKFRDVSTYKNMSAPKGICAPRGGKSVFTICHVSTEKSRITQIVKI